MLHALYPLVIKRGNGESPINGGLVRWENHRSTWHLMGDFSARHLWFPEVGGGIFLPCWSPGTGAGGGFFHRFSQQMEVIEPGFTSLELCWFNGISPTANGDFSCWFNDFPMENLAVIRRSTWKTTVFVDGWVILQPCLIPPPGCHFFLVLEFFFPIFWDQLQEYGDIIMIDDLVMVID